jgi:hypothetical protein
MQRTLRPVLRIIATLLCCIAFRGLPRAQQVSAAELLAPVGSTFHYYPIIDLFPWDSLQGADVLWDYTWTQVDSAQDVTYEVIEPGVAPAIDDYPDANRVVRSIQGTNDDYIIDRFFEVQADRVLELGSAGPVLSYDFDTPEAIYGLPMQLGDSLNGDYCFWSDGLGVQFHFCGESYVTHDATGTLILPYGTFTGVKHITQWHSSVETTEPTGDTTTLTRQQWFVPGIASPVLEVSVFLYNGGTLSPSGRIMDGATFTALAEIPATEWSAYVDPSSALLTLRRSSTEAATVEVLALDGRVLINERFPSGSAQHSIALDALQDALYLVRVSSGTGSSTQRIVKSR